MAVLVTGANGFAGRHLLRELQDAGLASCGLDIRPVESLPPERCATADLRDAQAVHRAVAELQPEACIHLGGIAFVPAGWTDPQKVMHINLIGTINLLEAFRLHAPAARILVVTSAEIYGREPAPAPIPETAVPQPANPYAVSKLGADSTARLFARRYDMPIITARPGNHIGPGQSASFVASSFAHQLAAIAQHRQESVMHVGNLDSERDFTDVRDVVRAYRMLLQKGVSGHAYNIASGHRTAIRDILDGLCRTAGLQPEIRVDPERWRPADTLPLLDITRIREQVGWMPRISLAQTLDDIYRHVAKGSQQGR